MAKEIERKFLVKNSSFLHLAISSSHIEQGYLSRRTDATIRVRLRDDRAYLTVKSRTVGMTRDEWEYEIPADDARAMLKKCAQGNVIDKTRHIVPFEGRIWEVDVFHGDHEGLVTAEVELDSEGSEITLPPFVGEEVTGDARYYNSNL